jgi:hypothetical protein
MKYYIDNLVIEVTRKCNMACAHCLRGEAQKIDIDTAYIDNLLENVAGIGNITFSGGEPSLNVSAIEYTLSACQERNISVGSFYIVTNGKANSLPLAIACLKWYAYCDCDEDMCGLALSKDMFHDEVPREHENVLKGLSFFRRDKYTDFNKTKIINAGRAEDLYGFDKMSVDYHDEPFSYFGDEEDGYTIETMIYLSANGEIRTNCDSAYDDDNFTIGDLSRDTFDYVVKVQMVEQMEALPI